MRSSEIERGHRARPGALRLTKTKRLLGLALANQWSDATLRDKSSDKKTENLHPSRLNLFLIRLNR